MAHVFGQQHRIFGPRCVFAQRFQNRPKLANRHLLAQQQLQDLLHFGQLHLAGDQLVDHGGRGLLQFVDQVLGRRRG